LLTFACIAGRPNLALEVVDGEAEALQPGLFQSIEPGAFEGQLLTTEPPLEAGSVALRLGQGKLTGTLIVTLENCKKFARLYVLALGHGHLFDAGAGPRPDDDHPRLWLQPRERADLGLRYLLGGPPRCLGQRCRNWPDDSVRAD
jgi:hypothetical protein